ncbi:glycosyltransferase [Afifella sp. JA880]|uniref:CgeB family protein n=1 Tax=Afifella sp. JA880 TaxID=2975280 RepID=UPI0021BA6344|nr:glycosyltransferase [Afifella sp. JA880]MCT8266284.1 glycosyltransferase [Afifella sp. JA880]
MRLTYFTHSLASCWNHGNAHFIRGILREMKKRGHEAVAYEPAESWSRDNLVADHGETPIAAFRSRFPDLTSIFYDRPDFDEAAAASDIIIVHEWTEPSVVAELGRLRRQGSEFLLLFHDTHHRAVSDPDVIRRLPISDYDGILAFGESLAEIYRRWGWGDRVFVWHEAADLSTFTPPTEEGERNGIVFVGNWGDDERNVELERFLFGPVEEEGLTLKVHGVRYPPQALARLAACGADYRGWIANAEVPDVFARQTATVHVPRRFYVEHLPGIPTIRVFEALACGIPLVSAYWPDEEALFRPGQDYLVVHDREEARRSLRAVSEDRDLAGELALNGLETVRARHSCAHRVDELLAIMRALRPGGLSLEPAAPAEVI